MKHYLKQFTALGTGLMCKLKGNAFSLARVRLTVLYTFVTMTIIGLFSVVLFVSLEKNARDVIEKNINIPSFFHQHHTFRNDIDDIERNIFLVDFILLFIVTGLGYVIAGKTLKPIKETMESQKRFLADASHDLRTPLAIMKSESQVLAQSNSKDINDYIKVIQSNIEEINKMSNLVDDILTIARTEVIEKSMTTEIVDIQNILGKLISKMEVQAHKKNILLVLKEFAPLSVSGNIHTLERAIQNIIQNAINYTPQNGSVSLSLSREKNLCIIKIVDTGVGIKEKDLPHVFDRFYKAEHSRNDASGSGLGLSIAKQIIEQHGGNIFLTSTLNKGTEVTITIPKI